MFYKIINKDSEVFKKLFDLRTRELAIEEENLQALKDRIGLEWETFFGYPHQQNARRVSQYEGFAFTEHEKVNPKIWVKDKKHQDIYIPNSRTKLGREMREFLWNGLQSSRYSKVFDILKLGSPRQFAFPVVEITDNAIIIYLGEKQVPKIDDLIEITSKEFYELRDRE
ncbi:hypothetical protein [Empedobacter falsenii]|uniref:Uncharacterized protein n=1 Tax=Empedobacter falsenii TaxID=343874 RepID=A0A376FXJ5_9FLAO|nr:hypothetical protein [Empedobacter falsenii]STD53055.1 Uncharacterised protein [Empedobacter falsenii]